MSEPGEVVEIVIQEDLDEEERLQYGQRLSEAELRVADLENEKKNTAAELKKEIDHLRAQINVDARILNQGFVRYKALAIPQIDVDEGVRNYLDPKTGHILKIENLSAGETHQGDIVF